MAIRIPLGHVKPGLNEFTLSAAPTELGLEGDLIKDALELSIKIEKVSSQLDLEVTIKGTLNLECDRCLEYFAKEFTNTFELVYVINEYGEMADDDYVRPYSPHMRYIDITKDVKDYTELTVPMRKVPEEKTDGACSWCDKTKEYWIEIFKDSNIED
jgi:uncharacterized protein